MLFSSNYFWLVCEQEAGNDVSSDPAVIKKGKCLYTVKLGIKKLLNKEQLGNSEPFPVINMPVHLMNSEQVDILNKSFIGQLEKI